MGFQTPHIRSLAEDNHKLARLLQSKISHKAKPARGLGKLETLALQLGLIQRSDVISLVQPQLLIFAGDHGVARSNISHYPSTSSTTMAQQVLAGGAASNVLARQHGFSVQLVDAGLMQDLPVHPMLIKRKIGHSTANFSQTPAMSLRLCETALQSGYDLATTLPGNVVAMGEIGHGSTASASMILSRLSSTTIAQATDQSIASEDALLLKKRALLLEASLKFKQVKSPMDVLQHFGGFETATMVGAMLGAASRGRVILVDGFCACAAALVAKHLCPAAVDHMVFAHTNGEPRHEHMLQALGVQPLLNLDLKMGEGVGALLAWPLVVSAGKILNEMSSGQSPAGSV
jgi:nicotinate-nucleotide--dimethylbenzimidazole phosphoribosyltransferase